MSSWTALSHASARVMVEHRAIYLLGREMTEAAKIPTNTQPRSPVNLEESELMPEGNVRQPRRRQDRDKLKQLAPPPQKDLFGGGSVKGFLQSKREQLLSMSFDQLGELFCDEVCSNSGCRAAPRPFLCFHFLSAFVARTVLFHVGLPKCDSIALDQKYLPGVRGADS